MEPDAVEIRVLGCLIEKQRTTPDVYPLTVNSLRLACNQSTNRDPVVDYDEGIIRGALDKAGRKAVVVVVPEHGAALRGDRMQIAGLREFATPSVTTVPVIVKDNYDTFDLATTGGAKALAGTVPFRDAFTVARLRAAGAIILAKMTDNGQLLESISLNQQMLIRIPALIDAIMDERFTNQWRDGANERAEGRREGRRHPRRRPPPPRSCPTRSGPCR